MFTVRYRGWFIHGHCDREEVRVQNPVTYEVIRAKSLHAAKCLISLLSRP